MSYRMELAGLVLSSLALTACGGGSGTGGGGGGDFQQARSVLCEGLTGGEAIAWDTYNGVIRLDSVLPPPPPAGPRYGHPGAIALTFTHPADWTPHEDNTSLHQFGVNLIRNDQQAVWRDFRKSHFVNVSARAARDNEIEILLDFLGQSGAQIQTVCANEGSFPSNGFVFSTSKIFLRTATHTALIDINVLFNPSLGSSNVNTKTLLAPTAEFGARAIDTFLAIDWQMNLGNEDGFRDSDGDGWRDSADIEPFNFNEPTPGGLPFR